MALLNNFPADVTVDGQLYSRVRILVTDSYEAFVIMEDGTIAKRDTVTFAVDDPRTLLTDDDGEWSWAPGRGCGCKAGPSAITAKDLETGVATDVE